MKKVKTIQRPQLSGAHVMTAAEMNKFRLSDKHTVLTPELLARVAARGQGSK